MCHMIHSVFYEYFSLQNLDTPKSEDTRRCIILLSLPEHLRIEISPSAIETKCLFIASIYCHIDTLGGISEKFIDPYSFSFSLDGDRIEFTTDEL